MTEIDVVLDIRQAPDSLDLIIVRQKLALQNGELAPTGLPYEHRLPLTVRRVQINAAVRLSARESPAMIATVRSLGLVPLDITSVVLETYPGTQDIAVQSFEFAPADRRKTGSMMPGEARDWYISDSLLDMASDAASSLAPDKSRIVAYAQKDEIGALPGDKLRPHLNALLDTNRIRINGRIMHALQSLSESDRMQAQKAIQFLRVNDPSKWPSHRLTTGDRDVYFLRISPQLFMVVRRVNPHQSEVIDFVHEDTLKGVMEHPEATSPK